jgi:hypothetical protein
MHMKFEQGRGAGARGCSASPKVTNVPSSGTLGAAKGLEG